MPTLRPATTADASTLALIGAATMLETYAGLLDGQTILAACHSIHTAEAYRALLARPATEAWLAELEPGAAPIGYLILAAPSFDPPEVVEPGDVELKRIYLLSRFHGSGLGQQMMDLALGSARASGGVRVLIGVHADNARALSFYGRNGFVEIARRKFKLGCCTFDDPVLALTL